MTYFKVRIVRVWDTDWYPGFAECQIFDALGAEHRFQDKIPIFSDRDVNVDKLPCDVIIRCSKCGERDGMIQVDTELPDHLESLTGQHIFHVWPNQLIDDKEDFS